MLQLWSEMARRKGAWEAFSCVVGEHTDAGGKKREKERKCCDVSMRDQTAESEWQLSKVWGLSLEQIDLACQSERSFSSIRQRRDKKKKRGRRGFHLFLISLAGCKRRRIAGRSRRKASQVAWVLIARPLSGRHVTILSILLLAVSPPILFFFFCFFFAEFHSSSPKVFGWHATLPINGRSFQLGTISFRSTATRLFLLRVGAPEIGNFNSCRFRFFSPFTHYILFKTLYPFERFLIGYAPSPRWGTDG